MFTYRKLQVPENIEILGKQNSLRAFASMRALRLFLRARAVINFCEQRALRKFFASWNLSLLRRCFAPRNLADTFQKAQPDRSKAKQRDNYVLIVVQPSPVAYSQLCLVKYAVCCKITSLSFTRVSGWTLNGI